MRLTADPDDRYLSIDQLAIYAGLSVRTLKRYMAAATNPLPYFKVGGRILVRRSDFDRWIEQVGTPDTRTRHYQDMVNDAINGVLGRRRR